MTSNIDVLRRYEDKRILIEIDPLRGSPIVTRPNGGGLVTYIGEITGFREPLIEICELTKISSSVESKNIFDYYIACLLNRTSKDQQQAEDFVRPEKWKWDERKRVFEYCPFCHDGQIGGRMSFHIDTVNRILPIKMKK